jgi:hypothetical protein
VRGHGKYSDQLKLDSYDARFILEALQEMSAKWRHIYQTTTDEDEQAEYGNDVMFLDSRRERIERLAVAAFGPQIANFPREPIAVTTPAPSGEHRRRR